MAGAGDGHPTVWGPAGGLASPSLAPGEAKACTVLRVAGGTLHCAPLARKGTEFPSSAFQSAWNSMCIFIVSLNGLMSKKFSSANIKQENYTCNSKNIGVFLRRNPQGPAEAGGRGGTRKSAAVQSPAHTRLLRPLMWQRAKCKPCVALKDQVWGRSGGPRDSVSTFWAGPPGRP